MRRILKQPIPDLLDRLDKEFTNSPLALKSALSRTVFICRQSVKLRRLRKDTSMMQKNCNFVLPLLLVCGSISMAQTDKPNRTAAVPAVEMHQPDAEVTAGTLDAQREKRALMIFLKSVQSQIVSAADAMPAVKYSFAPTEGEFKGVRTFGQQVKHLAATNHILAAAALGEEPPSDAGDEQGPENIRTKPELLDYLNASFTHLAKAIDGIGDNSAAVKSSPISPLPASKTTRLALTVEALIHAFDHYGQMVEYLRMNGVVPPASQP